MGVPEYDAVWTPSDPCPRAIHAELPCPNAPDECRYDNVSTIHSALVHCPGIEEVNLYFVDGYCRDDGMGLFNNMLPVIEEAKYPALKKMVLDGYRFGGPWAEEPQEGPKVYGMNMARSDDCRVPGAKTLIQNLRRESTHQTAHTSLAAWLKVMDWEQLEELSINWARNPERVLVQELARSGRLKNLKSLAITSLDFVEALENNTLTQLKWVGRTAEGELESILAHQGQSLRRLEYRCDEAVCPDFHQLLEFSTLPALAPNLEHISINMPRNGSLPVEDLRALASMPNLQTANLFFRMQSDCHAKEEALGIVPDCMWFPENDDSQTCNGTARYQLPYVNRTTGEDVFNVLREHKQGKEMQKVTLLSGDWTSGWGKRSFMSWRRARVTCTIVKNRPMCEAEGRLYYKGLWVRTDWKLTYASQRVESGVELSDEQLWETYNQMNLEEERQKDWEREHKEIGRFRIGEGSISYWWSRALEIHDWFNARFPFA